jgi:hypothetical protein
MKRILRPFSCVRARSVRYSEDFLYVLPGRFRASSDCGALRNIAVAFVEPIGTPACDLQRVFMNYLLSSPRPFRLLEPGPETGIAFTMTAVFKPLVAR